VVYGCGHCERSWESGYTITHLCEAQINRTPCNIVDFCSGSGKMKGLELSELALSSVDDGCALRSGFKCFLRVPQ
jgi:hypothetical protein